MIVNQKNWYFLLSSISVIVMYSIIRLHINECRFFQYSEYFICSKIKIKNNHTTLIIMQQMNEITEHNF